jgi:branched-chain amino acid transport system substrate-binding protein
MTFTVDRRSFITGAAAAAALPLAPRVSFAQDKPPLRIGLLCIKSGPLASGGIAMEEGFNIFLKERKFTISGRKTELLIGDTGGSPAVAKSKVQELVERDKVDILCGPLAANEALAIADYVIEQKIPILSFAAAEDLTQRKPNPFLVRPSDSAGQTSHALGDFAATERGYKRVAALADDFAFGHEQVGAFQRVFEDKGGKVVKKLFTPLNTADYGPYIAQIKDVDAVFTGHAGSNGLKFVKQCYEFGMKFPILGGQAVIDESLLPQMAEAALGIVNAPLYSTEIDTPSNKTFKAEMWADYKAVPGGYSSIPYNMGQFIEAALQQTGGRTDDREAVVKALRAAKLTDTPRGPLSFDDYGNVVINAYICEVKKIGDRYVNSVIKTYPHVTQFWTYDPKWYLAQPVYSRDYPPSRYLEP